MWLDFSFLERGLRVEEAFKQSQQIADEPPKSKPRRLVVWRIKRFPVKPMLKPEPFEPLVEFEP